MGCNMQKEVSYVIAGTYLPKVEAASKQVESASGASKVLSLSSGSSASGNTVIEFFNNIKLFSMLFSKNRIINYFSNLGDINHFKLFALKRCKVILTSLFGTCNRDELNKDTFNSVDKIIVESEKDLSLLKTLNIDNNKIHLIYPGIDLNHYKNISNPQGKFKILFASSPFNPDFFETRGINFLLNNIKNVPNVEFIFVWRKELYNLLVEKVQELNIKNITIINQDIEDMSKVYNSVNAVIVPYASLNYNKPCPYSILESLACERPVIVSEFVGISDLITKEDCGVVFKLNTSSFVVAINNLITSYSKYKNNSRKTAIKYFDIGNMLKEYKKVYEAL